MITEVVVFSSTLLFVLNIPISLIILYTSKSKEKSSMEKVLWWLQIPLMLCTGLYVFILILYFYLGSTWQLSLITIILLMLGSILCICNLFWLCYELNKNT